MDEVINAAARSGVAKHELGNFIGAAQEVFSQRGPNLLSSLIFLAPRFTEAGHRFFYQHSAHYVLNVLKKYYSSSFK